MIARRIEIIDQMIEAELSKPILGIIGQRFCVADNERPTPPQVSQCLLDAG